jgi:branched-chain amino acid transport system ATP-binding protein
MTPEHAVQGASIALLEVQDLHAGYGSGDVLQGVSFQLAAGESVGLLGRNGMGKTTLMKALMGLLRQRRGVIRLAGQDISVARPERIARLGLGYVPEGRGIFPNLSVRENLLMAARAPAQGESVWTLDKALATFPRLAERISHAGGQLSGGEQQMLAIGRALMTHPRVLLLDEATEGLAPLVVREIWQIVSLIRESGLAILIVDRNARAVLAHTDRALVLEKGRLALEGRSAELARSTDALERLLGV